MMGAVNFSLDVNLADVLKKNIGFEVFVETGTFRGETVEALKDKFASIYTIELSPEYFSKASSKFGGLDHIHVLQGDSSQVLKKVVADLHDASTLYFLDAHWCVAENTAAEKSQCPLLAELEAIGALNAASVIIIDDARLFLAPPPAPHEISQWPIFSEIITHLRALNDSHLLMVLNDNIIFYPDSANAVISEYGKQHGVDWLGVLHTNRDYDNLRQQFEGAENQLLRKDAQLDDLLLQLKAKDERADDIAEQLNKTFEAKGALAESFVEELKSKDAYAGDLLLQLKAKDQRSDDLLLQLKAKDQRADGLADQLNKAFEAQGALAEGFMEELKSKDARIDELLDQSVWQGELEKKIAELQQVCDDRIQVIEQQEQAINAFQQARLIFRLKAKWARGADSFSAKFRPRLGVLHQYPPKDISFSDYQCSRNISLEEWPRISIVTPSFQQADFIERTIKSVFDQGYPELEYFVQDGASSDATIDVLKQYNDYLTGWKSEPDSGQSQAINRGLSQTSGDIMAWLNSDDLLMPGSLACVANYFDQHPDVDVVYGHRLIIDEHDKEIGRWIMPPHDNDVLSWADYIPQETLFWRRSIWQKAGGKIDENFRFAMDWDLILRFRDAGAKFHRLPKFIGSFRVHSAQKTSAVINEIGKQEMDRLRERCLGMSVDGVEINSAISPYLTKSLLAHIKFKYLNI